MPPQERAHRSVGVALVGVSGPLQLAPGPTRLHYADAAEVVRLDVAVQPLVDGAELDVRGHEVVGHVQQRGETTRHLGADLVLRGRVKVAGEGRGNKLSGEMVPRRAHSAEINGLDHLSLPCPRRHPHGSL